jgi:predicted glycosyltransferase
MDKFKKRILISPLNWGLGHATRIIPLINAFVENNCEITIAGSGDSLEFLKREFTEMKYRHLPGITVKYLGSHSQIFSICMQIPQFIISIYREHRALKQLLKKERYDIILSDNRYGLTNKNAYCIIITHQINIKLPRILRFLEKLVNKFNHSLLRKFNECWIPDFKGELNLSGELSRPLPKALNAHYIGALSRFTGINSPSGKMSSDILAIISGPERQRSVFKSKLHWLSEKSESGIKIIPEGKNIPLNTNEVSAFIKYAGLIICRAGYTSIMDLIALNKNAILIPTPGQTEQEYLAYYHASGKTFGILKQHQLTNFQFAGFNYNLELKEKLQLMLKEETYKLYIRELANKTGT